MVDAYLLICSGPIETSPPTHATAYCAGVDHGWPPSMDPHFPPPAPSSVLGPMRGHHRRAHSETFIRLPDADLLLDPKGDFSFSDLVSFSFSDLVLVFDAWIIIRGRVDSLDADDESQVYGDRRASDAAAAAEGGLTKLLLLMQSGCSPVARQMALELLKIYKVNAKSCLTGYDTKTTHVMPFLNIWSIF